MEKSYPFIEAATFADEIKPRGWDDQANWHFVDNPYYVAGYYTDVLPEAQNITWALVLNLLYLICNPYRKN